MKAGFGVIAVLGMLLVFPVFASASHEPGHVDDASFSCRASVARITSPLPTIEPLIANADAAPCVDDTTGPPNISLPPDALVPTLSADEASASTETLCRDDDSDPAVTPANNDDCDAGHTFIDQQVFSRADAANLAVNLPGLVITVQAANTTAAAECNPAGVPVFSSTSRLVGLTINGAPIVIPPGDEPTVINLPGGITVAINERVGTEGAKADGPITEELIRRALRVTLGTTEVVVAESKVDVAGDVCPEGTIVVKKQTIPDEPTNSTVFDFAIGPGVAPALFSLSDDGVREFGDLLEGSYDLGEGLEPGYQLVGIECTDPSGGTTTNLGGRTAKIALRRGERVVCTFINGRVISTECPPGSEDQNGRCVLTGECPPGAVKIGDGECLFTKVVCPAGTKLVPSLLACLPDPGDGRFVPIGDVKGNKFSPCKKGPRGVGVAIIGTNGPDLITGTNRTDRIFAFAGNDRVSGGRGNDCIEGGRGRDFLDGSNGDDRLRGGPGNDIASGSIGTDRIEGQAGKDILTGGGKGDTILGGPGRDKIRGGDGNDTLRGGAGNDGIHTGNGKDRVFGGPGNDIINAATVDRPAFIDCGRGRRDIARVNRNELSRTRNCEFVDVLRRIQK